MSGVLGWVRDSPCIRQDRCLHLKSGYHGARTGWGTLQYAQKIEKRKGKKKKSTAGQLGQKVRPTASNDRPLCDMKKSPPAEHAVGPNSSEEHGKTFASQ